MRNTPGLGWARLASAARRGDFTERLTPDECFEFESIRTFSDYSPATTLFVEQEAPDNVLFLLTGTGEALPEFERWQANDPRRRLSRRDAGPCFCIFRKSIRYHRRDCIPMHDRVYRA